MKFTRLASSALCAALLSAAPASASIIYKFDFTNLTNVQSGTGNDFSITLTYSDYVQTTGMAPIAGPAQPTTLGYSVLYAGTSSIGWWGFDDDGSASIDDGGYSHGSGNQYLSFLFETPYPYSSSYYSAPGVYTGSVSGNAPTYFNGSASLTITDTNAVPEPGTLALASLALVGLAATRRRKQ